MKQSKIRYYLSVAFLALSLAGCDDNIHSSIPDLPVSLQLNLTSTYPTFKNSVNQNIIYKTRINETDRIGYGGIIICTGISFDDYGNSLYYAFDMACPFEAKSTIRVYPDSTGLPHLICEQCGSVYDFSFGNGNPISGPAKEFLKRYRASLSGDVLYIRN